MTSLETSIGEYGPLCVGLDPLPPELQLSPLFRNRGGIKSWVEAVIEACASRVGIVKFQSAHFEAAGSDGFAALEHGVRLANDVGLISILDAKRGDIASTARSYAAAYLSGPNGTGTAIGCRYMTVNPYLGIDTLEPFVEVAHERGCGLFICVRTSNPGAPFLQEARCSDGRTVSEAVADYIQETNIRLVGAGPRGPLGAVLGLTHPAEAVTLAARMPSAHLLVPGLGAQAGDPADSAALRGHDGRAALIASSRGITFPTGWAAAVDVAEYRQVVVDAISGAQRSLEATR